MFNINMINGLLLLARLYPSSEATTYDNSVFFEIKVEDIQDISREDIQLLEDWGWRVTESEDLQVWDW